MANMGYCRFQNTLMDLRDCARHLDDEDLSPEETDARYDLIKLMRDMLEYNCEIEDDD